MGYDLAAQYQAIVTELRAAREVIKAMLASTYDVDRATDIALDEYDATPKAVLDHQPDRST